MNDELLCELERRFELTPRDVGKFCRISKNGMRFTARAFTIECVGNCSLIKMRAMLGLTRMEKAVITTLKLDSPLFSFDLIRAMGRDTLLLELYDTQLEPFTRFIFASAE